MLTFLRFCQSFTALWQEKREVLESDYRVIYLFPHMSSQAGNGAVHSSAKGCQSQIHRIDGFTRREWRCCLENILFIILYTSLYLIEMSLSLCQRLG